MRGRPPKSTVDRELRGNPSRRPFNKNEPKPKSGLPPAPKHLGKEAKAEWRRTGKLLVKEKRMAPIYKGTFAMYCVAWQRWVEAEEELKRSGTVLVSKKGYMFQSPYLSISNTAMNHMRKAIEAMGLSPASQARVSMVAGDTADETDPFALLQGGRTA